VRRTSCVAAFAFLANHAFAADLSAVLPAKAQPATMDYEWTGFYVANPAYNADRGPANIFSGRAHWQF
jgi:hypothetical protein